MTERNIYTLKINENFKRLIPPLSPEEQQQLEDSIASDGCLEPLTLWNNTIVDGHNRYEICTRLQIPFSIQRKYFKNAEEVTVWICTNQLSSRYISDEMRKYLIGKRFEMEKILGAHQAAGISQHTKKEARPKMLAEPAFEKSVHQTSERLGKEYNISYATVEKYNVYSQSVDILLKSAPEIVPRILSGQIKLSHQSIIDLSRLAPKEAFCVIKQISNDENDYDGYSSIRRFLPKRQEPQRQLNQHIPVGSVKEMPVYDPDAEISSLALTIPSWISSVHRTRSLANLSKVSTQARFRLERELLELKKTVDSMLVAIKEEI